MGFILTASRGIRNLIDWFPVVWNDRDWDETHIYKFLEKKLDRMDKLHRNHSIARSEEKADEIKEYKEVLSRIIEDPYLEMARREICPEKQLNNLYKNFNRELRLELFKKEEELRQADIEKVFSKEVAESIETWWD